jgi:hypothetical protein
MPRVFPTLVDVEKPLSLASFYGYLKWAVAAALFWMAWRFGRAPASLALAGVASLIFVDDAFGLHEALAMPAAQVFGLDSLRARSAQDLGEIAVFLGMGVVALAAIGIAALRESPGGRRILAARFVVCCLCSWRCFRCRRRLPARLDRLHHQSDPPHTAPHCRDVRGRRRTRHGISAVLLFALADMRRAGRSTVERESRLECDARIHGSTSDAG